MVYAFWVCAHAQAWRKGKIQSRPLQRLSFPQTNFPCCLFRFRSLLLQPLRWQLHAMAVVELLRDGILSSRNVLDKSAHALVLLAACKILRAAETQLYFIHTTRIPHAICESAFQRDHHAFKRCLACASMRLPLHFILSVHFHFAQFLGFSMLIPHTH